MTRAQHACWLGVAPVKFGNTKECQLEKSAMGSLLNWQARMPAGALGPQLTLLKGGCESIKMTGLPTVSDEPYLTPQQADQLESTRIAVARIANNWWVASYSALQIEETLLIREEQPQLPQELETAQDDKQNDEADLNLSPTLKTLAGLHSLVRGSGPGVLIHDLLEQCAQIGFSAVQANPALGIQLIQKGFTASEWVHKQDIIASALSYWLSMPLLEGTRLCLAQLGADAYQAEMEFLLGADSVDVQVLDHLVTRHTFAGQPRPSLLPRYVNGLLKGFIDLVFVYNRQYYVVDYKFNSLGNDDASYTPEALEKAMLSKRYDLQYSLYLLALHRLLKVRMGAQYDYDTHIGGGLYLFLRGSQGPTGGRLFTKPPRELIEGLDKLFSASTLNGETL
jgi:exodeoxyribonuclease V beta subunit